MNREKKDKKPILDPEKMADILDDIYGKALKGIPKVTKPVDQLADDYIIHDFSPEIAAKKLIKNQIAKCTTSGFLTGLGGAITLAVTLPANITSVLYVQIRMIAAVAKIGGFDIYSDQVQSLVYACLTGHAISDVIKGTGIKVGEKFAIAAIKKLPTAVLKKINARVGFRLLTKFGEKGIINLVKLVPVAGGIIGGAFDAVSTKIIAVNAYNLFIKNCIPPTPNDNDPIIDVEYVEVEEEAKAEEQKQQK